MGMKMKKGFLVGIVFMLVFFMGGVAEAALITLHTDTDISAVNLVDDTIVFRKELSGFGGYGVADGRSDILYTGEAQTWSFDYEKILALEAYSSILSGINIGDYLYADITASLVLDDHYNDNVPTTNYSVDISINTVSQDTSSLVLNHGSPHGGVFQNWTSSVFDASEYSNPFGIKINNTSDTSSTDWIGIDYLELTLSKTNTWGTIGDPVPEPATLLLLGAGLIGLAGFRRKNRS